jgi:tetratricopeptide (TPR) repeat protein
MPLSLPRLSPGPTLTVTLVLGLVLSMTTACGDVERPDQGTTPSPSPDPGPIVAALPFDGSGLDSPEEPDGEEYLTRGLREEIISRTARLDGFRVIAPAREVDAEYLLSGRVDRADDGIRLLVRLADRSNRTLWEREWSGPLEEVFRFHAEIAEAVAHAVGVTPPSRELEGLATRPTRHGGAYDHLLRARWYGHRGDASDHAARGELWERAVDTFQEATRLDPEFAPAWAGLAFHHLRLHWFGYDRTDPRLEAARAALDRAEELAPDSPETLLAQGYWHYWGRMDYPAALERYEAARERLPGSTELSNLIAYVLRREGRIEEAAELLASGSDVDPTDAAIALEAGETLLATRDWERALPYLERARARAPEHPNAYISLAWLHIGAREDLEAARALLEEGAARVGPETFVQPLYHLELMQGDWEAALGHLGGREGTALVSPIVLHPVDQLAGFAHRYGGDEDSARRHFESAGALLDRLRPEYGPDHRLHRALALNEAALGQAAEARASIERAVQNRSLETDGYVGGDPIKDRAWVHTLTGDIGRALDDLELLLHTPTLAPITPAHLRLEPRWDPLRNEERFRAMAEDTP